MANLKEMTTAELKKYLSENRKDDDAFSEALGELLSRDPDRKRYPASLSFEEVGRIMQEKIDEIQKKKSSD